MPTLSVYFSSERRTDPVVFVHTERLAGVVGGAIQGGRSAAGRERRLAVRGR